MGLISNADNELILEAVRGGYASAISAAEERGKGINEEAAAQLARIRYREGKADMLDEILKWLRDTPARGGGPVWGLLANELEKGFKSEGKIDA